METLKKILKSKTLKEALYTIPDTFFNNMAFLFSMIFMINPLLVFIEKKITGWFPEFRGSINSITLYTGIIILIIYIPRYFILNSNVNIKKIIKEHIPIVLFIIFALFMIITTILNGCTNRMLNGYAYRGEGLLGYLSYIIYFVLLTINNNNKQKYIWLYTLLGSSTVLQLYTIIDFYAFKHYDYNFVFHQFNHYGYYLMISNIVAAMMIICSKKIYQKLIFSFSFFLSLLALIINDTFGCQLSLFIGLISLCIIYSLAKNKFKPVTLLPILLLFVTFAFSAITSDTLYKKIDTNIFQFSNDTDALINGEENAEKSSGVSRILLWKTGLSYIIESPLIGTGADVTAEDMLEKSNNDNDRCHCEYMNYAICFGIPAALIYVASVFTIYLRGLKHRKKLSDINLIGLISALVYLFSAVVGNSMFYTAPFLFVLLGMGYYKENAN